jgi:O-antigen ligase
MALTSTGARSAVLLGVLALAPLAIMPGLCFYFDVTPKILVSLAGTAAALLFGVPVAAETAPRRSRWLHVLLAAQLISLGISTVFSADRALSFTGTNWRRFGFLVQSALIIYTYLLSFEPAQKVLRAVAAGGTIAALYGVAQYFGWDPWLPKQGYHIGEGIWTIVRPPGTLGHAGYFGVYLLSVGSAGAALIFSDPSPAWRRWGFAAAGAAAAAILLTGSRSALLGLAAGAVTLAAQRRPRITARRTLAAAAVLATVGGFYFSPAGLKLRARARWYREDPGGGGRLRLWADTLRMARHRWAAGYGPETYSSEFPRFESKSLAMQFPDRYYESPHNIFLDALANQGAPGLLILAATAGLSLWAAWSNAAIAAGLIAMLAANQFLAFTLPTALAFYSWAALACGSSPAASSASLRLRAGAAAAASVLLAAAFSIGWADYWQARSQASFQNGAAAAAMAHYQRMRRWCLPGWNADLWYSRSLAAAALKMHPHPAARAAWQQAFEAAVRAANSSEQRPNAYYNLAAFYAVQNDFFHTEQSLRSAIAWAPHWYKPRWMLAQVLRQANRMDEAEEAARTAEQLDGGKHPEVTQTWNEMRRRSRQHK